MQTFARWLIHHRRRVVVVWIVAVVGVSVVASSVGDRVANNLTLPGTGTQQAVDLLRSHFAAQAGDADQIVSALVRERSRASLTGLRLARC